MEAYENRITWLENQMEEKCDEARVCEIIQEVTYKILNI